MELQRNPNWSLTSSFLAGSFLVGTRKSISDSDAITGTYNYLFIFIFILCFENIDIYLYILTQDILHLFQLFLQMVKYHNCNTYDQIASTFTHTTLVLYSTTHTQLCLNNLMILNVHKGIMYNYNFKILDVTTTTFI